MASKDAGERPDDRPAEGRSPAHHKLSDVDAVERKGTCTICGPGVRVTIRSKHHTTGVINWRCVGLVKKRTARDTLRSYQAHRKLWCEREDCPYEVDYACLLDVHHRDGNHNNHDPSNLMTLCAFCHRLVTYRVITV